MEDNSNVDIRPLYLHRLRFRFMELAHAQGLKLHSERHKLRATLQRIDRPMTSDDLHLSLLACIHTRPNSLIRLRIVEKGSDGSQYHSNRTSL
jgi:hypothetical protein